MNKLGLCQREYNILGICDRTLSLTVLFINGWIKSYKAGYLSYRQWNRILLDSMIYQDERWTWKYKTSE